MNPIERAASHIGSLTALAARLGVSASMVSQWKLAERPVSLAYCALIERETEGAVTVQELRPDLTWTRIADKHWPHASGRPLLDVASAKAVA